MKREERPFTYYTKKISLSSFREKTRRLRIFLNIRDSIHSIHSIIHSIIQSVPLFPELRGKSGIDDTNVSKLVEVLRFEPI